ncbi:50S ribosomal protein L2 [Candidatus Kuenenbacteria bacterium CG23_combo_of_CG06-09_8_20_14_all_36_9]|uniref:Large ribosomal subunit protein uL2 n=1 Tax=Candidatus Kuenenbacteria bacterium CG10_big_fil_rev_8_21_14_0_10_36_11 TaxID=1974618 RepID=A0A2M6WA23_9BACT|nr:MAG: 50S ribosomal protein L2 [Candidatus Kuenenbacteria bacterium CG23_combo_of_CG06-09_8_20_14_all_36_9]PIT89535.1 MAG: 50S ribosomal protein L2 [Candidatus Kuenenbacteria bacterium CG10_big_fil_rev_8_21_14_0_10_36_11]
MPLKSYKPTTPGRRHTSVLDSSDLTKKKRERSLVVALNKFSGRNNQGKITVRHRGGGAKKIYRLIDFKQQKYGLPAVVKALEYDPNRNARIALIEYADHTKSYILAADGLKVNETIMASQNKIEVKISNRMPLAFIPQGQNVYNIELEPGKGGKIARSAGTLVVLQNVEGYHAQLKMPSGEIRLVKKECAASIGQVSNIDAKLVRIGKAGRMRHKGIKPTVRGKAMNPVDHPHGGGEGKHPIGMKYPKTLWGKHALGVKTRKNKWTDKLILKRRKK